mmetsp:Transcript_15808/g.24601  ORF Transcript_15808/g.24601 Transcript_15808/m.24601 type:complete len:149 (-) Transcript_15808:51-497(-)
MTTSIHISEEEFFAIQNAFKMYDKDHDGYICIEDLRMAMKGMGKENDDIRLQKMISLLDRDGDEKIDFQDFLSLILTVPSQDPGNELFDAFQELDTHQVGALSRKDLQRIFEMMGLRASTKDIDDIMRSACVPLDGEITFTAFKKLIQ